MFHQNSYKSFCSEKNHARVFEWVKYHMPNSKRLGNFTEKSEILGKNRNCNEKTSHYLIKANKKNMLKAYCSALSTLGLLSNLRREWSGRIATFWSDFGAWKGEVFHSKSDHSKKHPGSNFFDIWNESMYGMYLSIGFKLDLIVLRETTIWPPFPITACVAGSETDVSIDSRFGASIVSNFFYLFYFLFLFKFIFLHDISSALNNIKHVIIL